MANQADFNLVVDYSAGWIENNNTSRPTCCETLVMCISILNQLVLYKLEINTLPLDRYIVHCNTSMQAPFYIRRAANPQYDFTKIVRQDGWLYTNVCKIGYYQFNS